MKTIEADSYKCKCTTITYKRIYSLLVNQGPTHMNFRMDSSVKSRLIHDICMKERSNLTVLVRFGRPP